MTPGPISSSKIKQFIGLLALALILTTLNAFKPLVADDPLYLEYARQFSLHPADPYNFNYLGAYQANSILVPPVAIYWLAAGIHLFGVKVFLLKMWLLPFSMLFSWALFSLFRRFAEGLEWPLVTLTVLSPVFLPTLNFMLDIPALGLCLAALACFLNVEDRKPWISAVFTGLIAGIAMQTKYTSVIILPLIFVYGFMFRRLGPAIVAIGIAMGCFIGWESVTAHLYGKSHFMFRYTRTEGSEPLFKIRLLIPLIGTIGGLAPILGMMGLGALGISRKKVLAGTLLLLTGYILLGLVPEKFAVFVYSHDGYHRPRFTFNSLLFGIYGLGYLAVVTMVIRDLFATSGSDTKPEPQQGVGILSWRPSHFSEERRLDWFLVAWLLVELGAYFVLSPFPAVRRVMGLIVITTILIGRLASRKWPEVERPRYFQILVPAGVALGLVFWAVNDLDARSDREVTTMAAQNIRREEADAKIWYMGGWGFGYYSEQVGMSDVSRGSLHPGDWLVFNRSESFQEQRSVPPGFELVRREQVADWLPLKNLSCVSAGKTAMEHLEGARSKVDIYHFK